MINRQSPIMKHFMLVLAIMLLAFPAFAGFREDVARDLGAKAATLVAPAGAEWLLDIDAGSGVQVGDLFVVMSKGAPVVHPVTKQVIGSLEEIRAVLSVTRIKSGYSYASVYAGGGTLKAGDQARRFAGLPALFWDYAGDGEGLFTQLQGALPELDWQGYAAAQAQRPEQPRPLPGMAPGLLFVYNAQGLGVKDQTFQPLRFYRPEQVSGKVAVAPAAVVAPAGGSIVTPGSPAAAPAPGALAGSSGASWVPRIFGGGSAQPGPGGVLAGSGQGARGGLIVNQMDNKDGVWYGPRIEGKPVGVEVGDVDGDGKNEVVLGFKDRLVVGRVMAGKYEPVVEFSLGTLGSALTLDGLDLDGNGRMELYLSIVELNTLRSIAVELRDGKLEPVIKNIPYLLRKVILPGKGAVLLGQQLNPDLRDQRQDFSGPIVQMMRNGDRLEAGSAVDLPKRVEVFGFQLFDFTGQPLVANLNVNDKLQVLDSAGAVLWESTDYFGGSESSFERPDGMQGGGIRYAFVEPRLEPGPDGTVLVPVNEGQRAFSAFRSFNSSHLKAVAYDGYSMVERWRTKPQGGYMADFRMADADNDGAQEIVMLVQFSRGGLLQSGSGNSALLIYEMQ